MIVNKYAVAAMSVALLVACESKEARVDGYLKKAENFLVQKDYDKARVEYKNVLQIDPKHLAGNLGMGAVFEAQSNLRAAASQYQRVLDASPANVDAKIRLARLYYLGHAAKRAEELADEVLKMEPENARALVVKAGALASMGKDAEAISTAQAALKLQATLADAALLLAGMEMKNKKPDAAVALLLDIKTKAPDNVVVRTALADVYAKMGRVDDAAAVLADIIKLEPKELSHRTRLAGFYARTGKDAEGEAVLQEAVKTWPENADTKIALASYVGAKRGLPASEALLQKYIEEQPKANALRFALASVFEARKEAEKAQGVYQSVIELAGLEADGLKARLRMASVELAQKHTDRAKTLIAEVLAKNTHDNEALLIRSSMALAEGNTPSAIADLRLVVRDQPESVPALKALGRAHMMNKEPDLALEKFRQVQALAPQDAENHLLAADVQMQKGQLELARAAARAALTLVPSNRAALQTAVDVELRAKDPAAARKILASFGAVHPQDPMFHYVSGIVAAQDGRMNNAETSWKAALALAPGSVEPLSALVRLYVESKRVDKAQSTLESELAKDESNVAALNLSGEIALLKSDAPKAEAYFKRALSTNVRFVPAYRGLVTSLMARNETTLAVKVYEDGILATQRDPALIFGLAELYEHIGEHEKAIATYEGQLTKTPDDQAVINNLAMLLASYRTDRPSLDRAQTLIQRISDKENPAHLDTIGWVHYARQEYTKAVTDLSKSSDAAPNSPLLRYHLGMAQYKAGLTAEAKLNLKKAVDTGRSFTGIDDAKRVLVTLASN